MLTKEYKGYILDLLLTDILYALEGIHDLQPLEMCQGRR